MDEGSFFETIQSGSVSGAYLLFGEEPYSRSQAVRQTVALIDESTRSLNVERLKNPAPATVIDACEALPLFSERRAVIVSELSADAAATLADYALHTPETTVLLLLYATKPNAQSPLFKALAGRDRTVEFAPFSPERAATFVAKRAAAQGAEIDRAAVRKLVERVGPDLMLLESTLSRLVDYAGPGRAVTVRAVEACVPAPTEATVFQILDALLAGNKRTAVTGLMELIKSGAESPMRLASFFAGRIKLMITAKQLLSAGMSEQSVVSALGGSPFAAKKTIQNARKCTLAQLVRGLEAFSDVDYLQKQGLRKDSDALLLAFYSFL